MQLVLVLSWGFALLATGYCMQFNRNPPMQGPGGYKKQYPGPIVYIPPERLIYSLKPEQQTFQKLYGGQQDGKSYGSKKYSFQDSDNVPHKSRTYDAFKPQKSKYTEMKRYGSPPTLNPNTRTNSYESPKTNQMTYKKPEMQANYGNTYGDNSMKQAKSYEGEVCKHGTLRGMSSDRESFEICDNDAWVAMPCAPGTWFDNNIGECTNGYVKNAAYNKPEPEQAQQEVPSCTGGQVWAECGSACTATCEQLVQACVLSCNARCECPGSRPVWHKSQCIQQEECPASGSSYGNFNPSPPANQYPPSPRFNSFMPKSDPGYNQPQNDASWHQVREQQGCTAGQTRPGTGPMWYEECVTNAAGAGSWVERKCAPGAKYDEWHGNCGGYASPYRTSAKESSVMPMGYPPRRPMKPHKPMKPMKLAMPTYNTLKPRKSAYPALKPLVVTKTSYGNTNRVMLPMPALPWQGKPILGRPPWRRPVLRGYPVKVDFEELQNQQQAYPIKVDLGDGEQKTITLKLSFNEQ